MPLLPPWKIVSPKGMLHFVPDKEALAHLSKSHGLRNEYLRNTIGFGEAAKSEHNGWQPLASSLPAGSRQRRKMAAARAEWSHARCARGGDNLPGQL